MQCCYYHEEKNPKKCTRPCTCLYLIRYLDLVPGGRYKVLRSTLYRGQVQGTQKYLVLGNRYKVLESTLYLPTGIRYRMYLVPQVQGTVLDTALGYIMLGQVMLGQYSKTLIQVRLDSYSEILGQVRLGQYSKTLIQVRLGSYSETLVRLGLDRLRQVKLG